MIKFPCPHCGQRVSVSVEHGGQQAICPKCGKVVTIPNAAGNGQGGSFVAPSPPATQTASDWSNFIPTLIVALPFIITILILLFT